MRSTEYRRRLDRSWRRVHVHAPRPTSKSTRNVVRRLGVEKEKEKEEEDVMLSEPDWLVYLDEVLRHDNVTLPPPPLRNQEECDFDRRPSPNML